MSDSTRVIIIKFGELFPFFHLRICFEKQCKTEAAPFFVTFLAAESKSLGRGFQLMISGTGLIGQLSGILASTHGRTPALCKFLLKVLLNTIIYNKFIAEIY